MSWRISIVELPDGEILIDGKPTDFAPPWKTEDAIRQQARDIAEMAEALKFVSQFLAEGSSDPAERARAIAMIDAALAKAGVA